MPAAYQGTLFRGMVSPLLTSPPPAGVSPRQQRNSLDLLKALNEEHQKSRAADGELAARIESYELAFPHAARGRPMSLISRRKTEKTREPTVE